ncbi:MAG: ABC transporter ATP-binding protein [Bryobacteraceae bacterium]
MIACRSLTRRFGNHAAVSALDLDIAPGGICALLGPNGAGKSTTIRLLTGLLEPTEGTATVNGLDVARHSLEIRRIAGVVPEHLGLFDALTVAEHLRLTADVWGIDRREAAGRATHLLAALGLEHGADTFAAECSHGMRKKTALAMALLPNPRVLFLDEPFEGLDPVTSKTVRQLFQLLAARGVTILFTSHILPIVEEIASRVVFIRGGVKVWDSLNGHRPASLETHYFQLVEAPSPQELPWLGSGR